MQVVEKTVEGPELQIVEKTANTPEIQTFRGTQTSESSGIVPEHQPAQAETVVDKIGAPLPTESALPMFVSTPVLETPRGVVGYVQIAAECAHARAITYAHTAPVVEYTTPASAVVHAAPVTTMTVAPTVLTAHTAPGDRYVDMPVVSQRRPWSRTCRRLWRCRRSSTLTRLWRHPLW